MTNLQEALNFFGLKSLDKVSEKQLKSIYHKLAGKYHPDKGGNPEDFISLRQFYAYLKNVLNNPNQAANETENQEQSFEKYKQAYEQSQEIIIKYQNIFNSQIKVVHATQTIINQDISNYQQEKENLDNWYKSEKESLESKKNIKFWKYMVGFKQMSSEEFFYRINDLNTRYNKEFQEIEERLTEKVVSNYRQGFSELINLLNDF